MKGGRMLNWIKKATFGAKKIIFLEIIFTVFVF